QDATGPRNRTGLGPDNTALAEVRRLQRGSVPPREDAMKDIFEQLTDEHELVLELVAELIDTADDEREVRAELLSQLRIELSAHAEAERTEVYARLRALSDSLGATIDDHLEQHDEIEALVLELVEGDIDADDFLDVVEELRAAVL